MRFILGLLLSLWASVAGAEIVSVPCIPTFGPTATQSPNPVGCAEWITPGSSSAAETSHVFKTTGGLISGFSVSNIVAAGVNVLLIDGTAAPSGTLSGCSTTVVTGCVLGSYGLAPGSATAPVTTLVITFPIPIRVVNGMVLACSTATPFGAFAGSNCEFTAQVE